jgi:hypothetical protein
VGFPTNALASLTVVLGYAAPLQSTSVRYQERRRPTVSVASSSIHVRRSRRRGSHASRRRTLWDGLRAVRLKLWDEQHGRLSPRGLIAVFAEISEGRAPLCRQAD